METFKDRVDVGGLEVVEELHGGEDGGMDACVASEVGVGSGCAGSHFR